MKSPRTADEQPTNNPRAVHEQPANSFRSIHQEPRTNMNSVRFPILFFKQWHGSASSKKIFGVFRFFSSRAFIEWILILFRGSCVIAFYDIFSKTCRKFANSRNLSVQRSSVCCFPNWHISGGRMVGFVCCIGWAGPQLYNWWYPSSHLSCCKSYGDFPKLTLQDAEHDCNI